MSLRASTVQMSVEGFSVIYTITSQTKASGCSKIRRSREAIRLDVTSCKRLENLESRCKYASSSWCLDELVEILNCEEAWGQIVMTIFYEVDPSDVRKQRGDFGSAFKKIFQGKTKEVKQRWTKALTHVANIAGEDSLQWPNEAEMIHKIATDVSKKVSVTPSRDFEGMVGLEAHLTKLDSLLCLERDDVKMIGIWGPAGIGKTTIARSFYNQLSSSFQLKCFMLNLMGVDGLESKLSLQKLLLSKIFNQG